MGKIKEGSDKYFLFSIIQENIILSFVAR